MAQAARRVVRAMPQIAVVRLDDTPQQKKKKVAAYARVSTDKEEQEDSFERQVEHYTHLIESNPEWTMVEVYKDPGITGTKAEKRPTTAGLERLTRSSSSPYPDLPATPWMP